MFLKRARSRKRSRATVMLEFALVMPFFFLFIAIMVDVSRLVFIQNAAQDAAFSSARAGAQVGYWSNGTQFPSEIAAEDAFNSSLAVRGSWIRSPSLDTTPCSLNDLNFYSRVDYTVVPIIGSLAGLGTSLSLSTTGVSRCEIVR